MSNKFIPNGDVDFAKMARAFAQAIAADPARVKVSQEDAELLANAVNEFRAALQAARFSGERSSTRTRAKEIARNHAEEIIRRLANTIRADKSIDPLLKDLLKLRQRSGKLKQRSVPMEPPRLEFVQALHRGYGATPMHELKFCALDRSKSKPAGAVRLELFVDLVPLDEPIPQHPGANTGSRPWYLRSYTKSPIVLVPPLPRVPMQVVYWARWADSAGEVGPFCATVRAWVEGGSHYVLSPALAGNKPVPRIENATGAGPADREHTYVIAVMEAQYQSMHPTREIPALPDAPEQKQLEGPPQNEAA